MATMGDGKICYLEIPARDVQQSAAFYQDVFGWNVRTRGDGAVAFDDGVGEVSGAWRPGRQPVDAGFVYIMVADIRNTCDEVTRHGGEVVEPPDPDAHEVVARFRDPAGNVFGVYQERSLGGGS